MFISVWRVTGAAFTLVLLAGLAGALSAFAAGPPRAETRSATVLPRVAAALRAGRPLRIVAFGSSSTEGSGATSRAATYPSQLQADLDSALPRLSIKVANRGHGGEDAEDMLARLPAIVAQHPDLVIWQLGTNSALHGLPLDEFIALTRGGIKAMRRRGIDVMLIEPQLCRAMQAKRGAWRYRDAVRAIGAELKVPVIRRYDLMKAWLADGEVTLAQLMSGDGLHMADKGYALLAKEVARAILTDADVLRTAAATGD